METFKVIVKSMKESALPGCAAVTFGLSAAVAYRCVPGVAAALAPVRGLEGHSVVFAAAFSQVVSCALLPALVYLVLPASRPRRLWLVTFANALWFGSLGVICLGFYTVQDMMFGSGTDFVTLLDKMLVDQLVFNPFFLAPLHAAFFYWEAHDFSWARTRSEWPRSFVRSLVLPNLLANYIFAVPLVTAMYSLPLALRVPFMSVVAACWSILCLRLGHNSSGREANDRLP